MLETFNDDEYDLRSQDDEAPFTFNNNKEFSNVKRGPNKPHAPLTQNFLKFQTPQIKTY